MKHLDIHQWRELGKGLWRRTQEGQAGASQWGAFAGLTVLGLAAEAGLALDDRRQPDLQDARITAPVFVLGNARSGTTVLHRLLAHDPRFATLRTWQVLFPALSQRALIEPMNQLVSSLPRIAGPAALQAARQRHPLAWNEPEEDTFLLLSTFSTPVLQALFPGVGDASVRFDQWPATEQARTMERYVRCLKRHLHRAPGCTLLSKSPAFVSMWPTLDRWFPDARYVYCHRDPATAITSLCSALREVWLGLGIAESSILEATDALVEGCLQDYELAAGMLERLPERCVTVSMGALHADRVGTMGRVYESLGMTASETVRGSWEVAPTHPTSRGYELGAYVLDVPRVEARTRLLRERLGGLMAT